MTAFMSGSSGRWEKRKRRRSSQVNQIIRFSWLSLATNARPDYSVHMLEHPQAVSSDELRERLRPFCEKHRIRRLEVFGSAAVGLATPSSDVDLLVTLDESNPVSTAELLEMAGEAEELIGRPVDFVLRPSLEKSPNRFAREHIFGYRRVLV